MGPDELHNPIEHASVSFKVVLLIFSLIVVGVLSYAVWDYLKTPDTTDNDVAPTTTTKTDDTAGTEIEGTSDWITYTNNDYSMAFKYPPSWRIESEDKVKFDDVSPSFTGTYLTFITDKKDLSPEVGETYDVSAQVSTTDYAAYAEYGQGNNITALSDLRKIFSEQKTSLEVGEFLPRTNWGIFASGAPSYLKNSDNNWRGYYFFSTIGQDYNQVVTAGFNLTDGITKVVSMRFGLYSYKAESSPCTTQECINSFYDYVSTISDSSTKEPAVQYFNSTFKKIAQTVKSI